MIIKKKPLRPGISRDDIKRKFKEWVDEEVPDLISIHEFKPHDVIIEVFEYVPDTSDVSIIDTDGSDVTAKRNSRHFPIAKVLYAGPDSKYHTGDLVKLNDWEVKSIENPEYDMWVNNEYKNSNMKRVGKEPPQLLSNLSRTFGPKMIILDIFSTTLSRRDYNTFKVLDGNISHKLNKLKLKGWLD